MTKSTLLGLLFLLISLISRAQSGADPAVTSRSMSPNPITGSLLAPFTMTFLIGNNGTFPISGADVTEKMQFSIALRDCRLKPASTSALSGQLLNYFDVTYNATNNTLEGVQKQGVSIPPITVRDLVISAEVTSATATAANNTIGGKCTVTPNSSSLPQVTDNDVAQIYSHTTQTAMPVSLVSFNAQAQENRTVLLTWKTSWEQNNKGYVIERSKDLTRFESVGEMSDVAGSSNSINSYQFVDPNPVRGLSYYRLRQLDLDGSSRTYDAKSVEVDGQYSVYPNPVVNQQFTLNLDEPSEAILHLYSATGNELKVKKSTIKETSVEVTPSSKLIPGIYVLTVGERGNTRKYRLVVQ